MTCLAAGVVDTAEEVWLFPKQQHWQYLGPMCHCSKKVLGARLLCTSPLWGTQLDCICCFSFQFIALHDTAFNTSPLIRSLTLLTSPTLEWNDYAIVSIVTSQEEGYRFESPGWLGRFYVDPCPDGSPRFLWLPEKHSMNVWLNATYSLNHFEGSNRLEKHYINTNNKIFLNCHLRLPYWHFLNFLN